MTWAVESERREHYRVRNDHVLRIKLHGCVFFCDMLATAEEIRRRGQRLPRTYDVAWIGQRGSVLSDVAELARSGRPDEELLLSGALAFTRRNLTCVVPPEFTVPIAVQAVAARRGVQITVISSDIFAEEERRRMLGTYMVGMPSPDSGDMHDKAYLQKIVDRYASIMRQFW